MADANKAGADTNGPAGGTDGTVGSATAPQTLPAGKPGANRGAAPGGAGGPTGGPGGPSGEAGGNGFDGGGPNRPDSSVQAAGKNPYARYGFVAQVTSGGNNVRLQFCNTVLRGEFNASEQLPSSPLSENYAGLPTKIPGLMIGYYGHARRVEIRDPMGKDVNKAVMDRLKEIIKLNGGQRVTFEKDREFAKLSNDLCKEWLYWMRRMLDNGQLRMEGGVIPSMEEIESLPGKVRHLAGDKNPLKAQAAEERPSVPYVTNKKPPGMSDEPTASTHGVLDEMIAGMGRS